MGAKFVNNTEIKSMKSLVDDEKFDAVFVGTGAPKGKNLIFLEGMKHLKTFILVLIG